MATTSNRLENANRRAPRVCGLFAALALVSMLSACVSGSKAGPETLHKPALLVAKSVNGVKLQWDTWEGDLYTVVYSEDLQKLKWQPLEGCVNLRGTGGTMLATDDTPDAQRRFYRLSVIQADRTP